MCNSTLQWHHEKYTNTCTVDNLMSALLLHCQEHPTFLSTALGNTEPENALEAALKLMMNGNLDEGKTVMLQFAHSKIIYHQKKNV